MQSKSFGQWYQDRKKEPTTQSIRNSWMSSFLGSEENGGDLESASLLSRARNVGTKVSEVSETMKEVLMLFGVAVIFFVIAYFVGLPTLLFRPAKFTISFTMGSIMTLGALARLKGFTAFIKSILAPNRVVQSSLYLISLLLSICSAVIWKSYVWTVVCSIFQMAMLALFVLESFPAGARITQVFLFSIRKLLSLASSFLCHCLVCSSNTPRLKQNYEKNVYVYLPPLRKSLS
ncbi:uncharacterized protein [Blastocystis hominis]|uniref:Vesicle transport protein n=1 Tax=Blastocystis hominis TaxID=12968 RepID=D8M2I2_BLAHO|nr:uncharacterized protein [Blastocystis hominis]CBK22271.2 unnamed protein product [Blastocystis hominis]|eukprot:XP_012896319.1 uncharacterized protein [Blastocystis hominis]